MSVNNQPESAANASAASTERDPDRPLLTQPEREAINRGRWFAALTPSLRHDIFRLGRVTRYAHGQLIVEQGGPAQDWFTCASGAIRFRRTTRAGRPVTLAYVEPGIWVGEAEVLHGGPNTYDAHAHGPTTVLSVAEEAFRQLLRQHSAFGEALLTLQARRMRYLYWMMEDMATLPLRARLAKQLLHVLRRFGERPTVPGQRGAIGLSLVQDELAQLLGGSRQRINVELKWMEREGIIGIHQRSIVIYLQEQLEALAQQETSDARAETMGDNRYGPPSEKA
ncbi:Crp/Fnr family transcriptional regulator [Acidovorax sp.]|uniref:Crp/Fnr family transcriptional regulator n=1 Tax=Acidovorax sp. TaxID=1872122 RepID=UPI002615E899|nr:Crp/Fnr family transcriptional regulator [Acidovorax sp.]